MLCRAVLSQRGRAWLAIGLGLGVSAFSPALRAQSPSEPTAPPASTVTEVSLAETLYREGRQLMSEQRYAEACSKFAESQRLDPATGTLLNLGACQEAQGNLASAWLAFSEGLQAARREQREERVQFAEERIAAIEPRLSRLTVQVSAEVPPSLVLRLDGIEIGPAAYGVAAPIDPGTHRIEASAPGHHPWRTEVTIGATSDRQVITVPALERAHPSSPPSAPASMTTLSPPRTAFSKAPDLGASPSVGERPVPTTVYLAAATTVAFTGAAVVTGVAYLDQRSEYSSMRDDEERSKAAKKEALSDARTMGWINMGFSAAALVSAGVTVYLYSSRPEISTGQRPASLQVGVRASRFLAGLTVQGAF